MNHYAVAMSLTSAVAFEEVEEIEANVLQARDTTEVREKGTQLFCANIIFGKWERRSFRAHYLAYFVDRLIAKNQKHYLDANLMGK